MPNVGQNVLFYFFFSFTGAILPAKISDFKSNVLACEHKHLWELPPGDINQNHTTRTQCNPEEVHSFLCVLIL